METAREVAEKFAESIVACQLKTKNHLANAIESALTQFAEAKVKAYIDAKYPGVDDPELNTEFWKMRDRMGWFVEKIKSEGFAECREKAAKLAEWLQNSYSSTTIEYKKSKEAVDRIRALTPDGKEKK